MAGHATQGIRPPCTRRIRPGDPGRLEVTGSYALSGDPDQIAVFDNRVRVGDGDSGSLEALDPSTGRSQGKAIKPAGPAS